MTATSTPNGFIELNIPVVIIGDCHSLHSGQRVQLSGSTQQMGCDNADDVKIYAKRQGDWLSFGINAGETGPMFQDKLKDTWKCDIVSIELLPSPVAKSPDETTPPPSNSRQPAKRKKSLPPARSIKTRSASKTPKAKVVDETTPIRGTVKVEPCGLFDPTEVNTDDPLVGGEMPMQDDSLNSDIETSEETPDAKLKNNEHSGNVDDDADEIVEGGDDDADYSSHEDSDFQPEAEEPSNQGDMKVEVEVETSTSLQTTPRGRKKYDRSKYKEGPRKKRRKTTATIEDLVCEFCTRTWFLSYKSYHRHLNSCQQNPENITHEETEEEKAIRLKYTCPTCNMACGKNRLKRHLEIAHGILVKKDKPRERNVHNICQFCNVSFPSIGRLYRHKTFKCHKNPNVRLGMLRICRYCGNIYDADNLQKHIDKVHPDGYKKSVCDICGKLFDTRILLYNHKRRHLEHSSKKFQCQLCQKEFPFRNVYNKHVASHSDVRPFVCDFCGKKYKTKDNLRSHVNCVHKNTYPYHCEVCGHGVQKKQYLDVHQCGRVRRKQDSGTGETEVTSMETGSNLVYVTEHTVHDEQLSASEEPALLECSEQVYTLTTEIGNDVSTFEF